MIKDIYDIIGHIREGDPIKGLPFINYYLEPKEGYKKASLDFVDLDDDFLIGSSGGILMNMDFIFIDTKVFSEVAEHYNKYKRYCDYKPNTIEYKDFWKRETQRRRKGMTSNCKLLIKDIPLYFNETTPKEIKDILLRPLRITGTHYNYLNYARINRTQNEEETKNSILKGNNINKTIEGFARFWDGDYWKFKIDEFVLKNNFNNCDAKARRKGFTAKEAGDSSNEINLNPNTFIIHAAYDADKYLTKKNTLSFLTKKNLDWYENHTYWKRGFLSEDLENIITGYKIRNEGNKFFGDQSSLISVSLRTNTSAAAGQTASRIKFEESGVNAVLQTSLDITLSTTEVGANKVGNIRIFGTGGTKDANWTDFMNIYYNPIGYGMLPMENIWDINSRDKCSGFFFSNIWCYEPCIDEHGNSKIIDAYYIDIEDKEHQKKYKKGEDYLIYVGQRANRPEEAFLTTTENMFTSIELNDHIKFVKYSDDAKIHTDGLIINDNGKYVFRTNEMLKLNGTRIHPFILDVPFKPRNDNVGCLRIFHRPYHDREGIVSEDIYFISYDTVRVNKTKEEITSKHSLNSFKIWEKPNVPNDNHIYRVAASYCGRHDTMEEADRLALNCCEWYHAKLLFEYGTGETYMNFKKWGRLDRLLKDPTSKLEYKQSKSDVGFGIIIGDGEKKLDGLSYLREWLYTPVTSDKDGNIKYNLHYIYDLPFLLELQNFDLKHNFDRISDAIVAIYYIKAQLIKKQKDLSNTNSKEEKLTDLLNSFSL